MLHKYLQTKGYKQVYLCYEDGSNFQALQPNGVTDTSEKIVEFKVSKTCTVTCHYSPDEQDSNARSIVTVIEDENFTYCLTGDQYLPKVKKILQQYTKPLKLFQVGFFSSLLISSRYRIMDPGTVIGTKDYQSQMYLVCPTIAQFM